MSKLLYYHQVIVQYRCNAGSRNSLKKIHGGDPPHYACWDLLLYLQFYHKLSDCVESWICFWWFQFMFVIFYVWRILMRLCWVSEERGAGQACTQKNTFKMKKHTRCTRARTWWARKKSHTKKWWKSVLHTTWTQKMQRELRQAENIAFNSRALHAIEKKQAYVSKKLSPTQLNRCRQRAYLHDLQQ